MDLIEFEFTKMQQIKFGYFGNELETSERNIRNYGGSVWRRVSQFCWFQRAMSICPLVPNICPVTGISDCLDNNGSSCASGGNVYQGLGEKLLPFCSVQAPSLALRIRKFDKIREVFYNKLMKEVGTLPNDFCRICREAETSERLLAPCNCKGTMALVHVSCLQRWLREADSSSCELCGHQYHVVRTPRYGLLKSIYVWLRYHSSRDLLFDAVAFCAFTPLAILGTYLGVMLTHDYGGDSERALATYQQNLTSGRIIGIMAADIYDRAESSGRSDVGSLGTRMAALGVVSIMTIINFSYLTWFVIRAQHYTGKWYTWWRRHFAIAIILPPEVLEGKRSPVEESNVPSQNGNL